jgi:ribokinase
MDNATRTAPSRAARRSNPTPSGGRVVVLGSLNVDHTVWVDRLPARGETILARAHTITLGGKGLNQAVAAVRQGASVRMVGSVGADPDGERVTAALMTEGIDVSLVRRHDGLPTGRAHITVDDDGGNTIVVVPGANLAVDFPSAALEGASVLLAQLECPLQVVVAALAAARAAGVVTVLNPSPSLPLDPEVLGLVDYLVPNHHEARALGVEENGVATSGTLIITRGGEGASVRKGGREKWLPPVPVSDVVDPTAAGDAFCGTLAAGLALGHPFGLVLARAAAAGAHTVTVPGALPALPTAADVDSLLAADQ